jgi:glycosyltransferase involved in cell wall biosynthesis
MPGPSQTGGSRPSVSLLGWGLDEESNLPVYIERAELFLRAVTDDFELILVDDGSTDRTWEIASALQATRPWMTLLKNDRNRGAAYSARRAIAAARKDYLFWQTLDWAYDLTELQRAFPLLATFDVLQGVRADALGPLAMFGHRSDNVYKGLISVVNYRLIRTLFRLPISDYQNVTVYPTRLVQSLQFETDSSFMNPEMLLKTWWQGASFKEVAVPFRKRQHGVAKGTRLRFVVGSIIDIWLFWFRWIVLGRRPHKGRGRVERV